MAPKFINQNNAHIFSFYLDDAVHQGLRYEARLYVFYFCAKDGPCANAIALAQGKLGDRTVIVENGEIYKVWIEAKPSTCHYWDIINKASLGVDLPSGWTSSNFP